MESNKTTNTEHNPSRNDTESGSVGGIPKPILVPEDGDVCSAWYIYNQLKKKKKQGKRRKTSELQEHERWNCPFGCGKFYRTTSTRSIHKHPFRCPNKPAGSLIDGIDNLLNTDEAGGDGGDNSGDEDGSDGEGGRKKKSRTTKTFGRAPRRIVNGVLAGNFRGIPSVAGVSRQQRRRRDANELREDEKWYCPFNCQKFYKTTSTRAIYNHITRCSMRPDWVDAATGSGPPTSSSPSDNSPDSSSSVTSPYRNRMSASPSSATSSSSSTTSSPSLSASSSPKSPSPKTSTSSSDIQNAVSAAITETQQLNANSASNTAKRAGTRPLSSRSRHRRIVDNDDIDGAGPDGPWEPTPSFSPLLPSRVRVSPSSVTSSTRTATKARTHRAAVVVHADGGGPVVATVAATTIPAIPLAMGATPIPIPVMASSPTSPNAKNVSSKRSATNRKRKSPASSSSTSTSSSSTASNGSSFAIADNVDNIRVKHDPYANNANPPSNPSTPSSTDSQPMVSADTLDSSSSSSASSSFSGLSLLSGAAANLDGGAKGSGTRKKKKSPKLASATLAAQPTPSSPIASPSSASSLSLAALSSSLLASQLSALYMLPSMSMLPNFGLPLLSMPSLTATTGAALAASAGSQVSNSSPSVVSSSSPALPALAATASSNSPPLTSSQQPLDAVVLPSSLMSSASVSAVTSTPTESTSSFGSDSADSKPSTSRLPPSMADMLFAQQFQLQQFLQPSFAAAALNAGQLNLNFLRSLGGAAASPLLFANPFLNPMGRTSQQTSMASQPTVAANV